MVIWKSFSKSLKVFCLKSIPRVCAALLVVSLKELLLCYLEVGFSFVSWLVWCDLFTLKL